MSMIILNPTNERIEVTYHGLPLVFNAGEKLRVKDSVGRQVIHNYANRGIVSLEYGDEGAGEMEKAEAGKEKNLAFKTKQCIHYNQINDRRKQSGQPFIDPPKQIKGYAKELGIRMLEPYRLEDSDSREISLLMKQNESLKEDVKKKDVALGEMQNQIKELTGQFKDFLSLAGGKKDAAPAAAPKKKRSRNAYPVYHRMSEDRFMQWLAKNWEEIKAYSEDDKEDVVAKYTHLLGTPFPTERPLIEHPIA